MNCPYKRPACRVWIASPSQGRGLGRKWVRSQGTDPAWPYATARDIDVAMTTSRAPACYSQSGDQVAQGNQDVGSGPVQFPRSMQEAM